MSWAHSEYKVVPQMVQICVRGETKSTRKQWGEAPVASTGAYKTCQAYIIAITAKLRLLITLVPLGVYSYNTQAAAAPEACSHHSIPTRLACHSLSLRHAFCVVSPTSVFRNLKKTQALSQCLFPPQMRILQVSLECIFAPHQACSGQLQLGGAPAYWRPLCAIRWIRSSAS